MGRPSRRAAGGSCGAGVRLVTLPPPPRGPPVSFDVGSDSVTLTLVQGDWKVRWRQKATGRAWPSRATFGKTSNARPCAAARHVFSRGTALLPPPSTPNTLTTWASMAPKLHTRMTSTIVKKACSMGPPLQMTRGIVFGVCAGRAGRAESECACVCGKTGGERRRRRSRRCDVGLCPRTKKNARSAAQTKRLGGCLLARTVNVPPAARPRPPDSRPTHPATQPLCHTPTAAARPRDGRVNRGKSAVACPRLARLRCVWPCGGRRGRCRLCLLPTRTLLNLHTRFLGGNQRAAAVTPPSGTASNSASRLGAVAARGWA